MSSIISTDNAPKAIGPYSQAVCAGGLVFTSGQIALDPQTGALVGGDITAQTRQVCGNIKALLEAAGEIHISEQTMKKVVGKQPQKQRGSVDEPHIVIGAYYTEFWFFRSHFLWL